MVTTVTTIAELWLAIAVLIIIIAVLVTTVMTNSNNNSAYITDSNGNNK